MGSGASDAALGAIDLPERTAFKVKRALLGPPLISARLHDEKLSKKSALGVLSSDCISSSAYGSEEMLIFLLPAFGLAGFRVLLPVTLVVLFVLVVMTLLYRQVVMIYTQAGGSYVVARDNFGPKIAQIAAVALLIDYVVTVAVQSAAGTAAVTSLVPALAGRLWAYAITVAIIAILAYGNLRGVREAGRAFAFPTYFFVATAGLAIVVGIVREILGQLPVLPHKAGMDPVTNTHHAVFTGFAVYVLLKAFANGGASLTGLEAISNGVSAFKRPAGTNARTTLTVMSLMLGSLVLGISYLAYRTHATPYASGTPTVISQVAHAAFGSSWVGHVGFVLLQVATALILWTGANTPFTGFPFLASFIAEDSFLPRQMTRRGHRLAFSNGIIVLTVLALALITAVGTKVDALIPFYAIGVFTGFAMAGYGMAHHYRSHRGGRWRAKLATSLVGGGMSTCVVLIFAVVKFTQGAWLVVVLFPVMWFVLLRLNARYRAESRSLDLVTSIRKDQAHAPHYGRHTVLVLVDRLDLAVLRALRYAGSLRPTDLRAVHVSLDNERARQLEQDWLSHDLADRFPPGGRRVPGPPAGPDGDPARVADGCAGPRGGDGAAAPAHVQRGVAATPARPHRRPDRRRGEPGAARERDHRPVRHNAAPRHRRGARATAAGGGRAAGARRRRRRGGSQRPPRGCSGSAGGRRRCRPDRHGNVEAARHRRGAHHDGASRLGGGPLARGGGVRRQRRHPAAVRRAHAHRRHGARGGHPGVGAGGGVPRPPRAGEPALGAAPARARVTVGSRPCQRSGT